MDKKFFPSPIGDLFYLIYETGIDIKIYYFPSPIGDLFYLMHQDTYETKDGKTFRPLSGTYFI